MMTHSHPRPPSCPTPTSDAPGKRRKRRRQQMYRETIDQVLDIMASTRRNNRDIAQEMNVCANAVGAVRYGTYRNMSAAQRKRACEMTGQRPWRFDPRAPKPPAADVPRSSQPPLDFMPPKTKPMPEADAQTRIRQLERDKAIMQTCIEILVSAGVGVAPGPP